MTRVAITEKLNVVTSARASGERCRDMPRASLQRFDSASSSTKKRNGEEGRKTTCNDDVVRSETKSV